MRKSKLPTVRQINDQVIQVEQTKALTTLGNAISDIATFLKDGSLTQTLAAYSKSQIVKDIMGGLAAHGGREALDARFIQQNAIEIVHAIEAIFDKAAERSKIEGKDPEIKNAEQDYLKWKGDR